MAAFSLCIVAAIRALRIAAKTAKFQIIVPPTDMARWSIQIGSAIRQTRRTQRLTVQLFVHCERLKLQTKDKEGDITIEYYYNDGESVDRTGN